MGAGAAHRAGRRHALSSVGSMTHDVTYREWVWADTLELDGDWVTRHEHEKDVTRTWGLHAGYQQPLGAQGWRIGGIPTANLKSNRSNHGACENARIP